MLKFDDSEFLRCTWPCCKGIIADAKVDAFKTPGAFSRSPASARIMMIMTYDLLLFVAALRCCDDGVSAWLWARPNPVPRDRIFDPVLRHTGAHALINTC